MAGREGGGSNYDLSDINLEKSWTVSHATSKTLIPSSTTEFTHVKFHQSRDLIGLVGNTLICF